MRAQKAVYGNALPELFLVALFRRAGRPRPFRGINDVERRLTAMFRRASSESAHTSTHQPLK
jgi:hypothetical protein